METENRAGDCPECRRIDGICGNCQLAIDRDLLIGFALALEEAEAGIWIAHDIMAERLENAGLAKPGFVELMVCFIHELHRFRNEFDDLMGVNVFELWKEQRQGSESLVGSDG